MSWSLVVGAGRLRPVEEQPDAGERDASVIAVLDSGVDDHSAVGCEFWPMILEAPRSATGRESLTVDSEHVVRALSQLAPVKKT